MERFKTVAKRFLTRRVPMWAVITAVILSIGLAGASQPQAAQVSDTEQSKANQPVKVVTKTETKTVMATPASCKAVIDSDNNTFVVMGNALQELDFGKITDHLNSVQAKRNADIMDCYSH